MTTPRARLRCGFRFAGHGKRKVVVAVIGLSVLAFGVALIVLPGPAILVIPLEVDGRLTLDVAARELGLLISDTRPNLETLAGHVVAQLGELSKPGDSIVRGGFRLTVLEVRDGRVRRLRGACSWEELR